MTRQQREAIADMLRASPFDLREQRPLFEKMTAADPGRRLPPRARNHVNRVTSAAAAREVRDQDVYGVYVPPGRPGAAATAIVATASGNSVTSAVESLFRTVAARQGAPLAVRDVAPLPTGDSSGLSPFFFFIACTLGGFLAVTATAIAAPGLRPRYRWPLFLAASVAIPALAYLPVGQGLGGIGGSAGAVFALLGMAALYVLIVEMIVRGLQLTIGVIGTLFVGMTVFVLINLPSSGDSTVRRASRGAAADRSRPGRLSEQAQGASALDGLGPAVRAGQAGPAPPA